MPAEYKVSIIKQPNTPNIAEMYPHKSKLLSSKYYSMSSTKANKKEALRRSQPNLQEAMKEARLELDSGGLKIDVTHKTKKLTEREGAKTSMAEIHPVQRKASDSTLDMLEGQNQREEVKTAQTKPLSPV